MGENPKGVVCQRRGVSWRTIALFCVGSAPGALLLLVSEPAFAHITQGSLGGFGSGFEHPLTGADHFLAMLAVGIWGAQMGGRPVWALPVTFGAKV